MQSAVNLTEWYSWQHLFEKAWHVNNRFGPPEEEEENEDKQDKAVNQVLVIDIGRDTLQFFQSVHFGFLLLNFTGLYIQNIIRQQLINIILINIVMSNNYVKQKLAIAACFVRRM